MITVKRSLARVASAAARLLSGRPAPSKGEYRNSPSNDFRPGLAVISSPWRIYRIYARPGRLLLRDEQGTVLDLGVMKGSEPNLTYRLYAKNLRGRGFATRALLLDDIARRIEAGEIGQELLHLPRRSASPGADLDRGTHMDVSMKLAR